MWPHRRQPTRLPRPWDSPGKNTGVSCLSFSNASKWKVKVKSLCHAQLLAIPWLQPTRLLRPWDFPGKSTGVGCHCLLWKFLYIMYIYGSSFNWSYLTRGKSMDGGAWRLRSMGSLRVRHDWVTSLSLFTLMHWRRKWQPTPVFLPGESQGRGSLVGCHLWGHTESDTTDST